MRVLVRPSARIKTRIRLCSPNLTATPLPLNHIGKDKVRSTLDGRVDMVVGQSQLIFNIYVALNYQNAIFKAYVYILPVLR